MSFVHLHVHSVWSLLDGALRAEDIPALAAERGMQAVALTDHDALTGAVRFTRACRRYGVKPIYGAELTLDDGGHVTVLARDRRGYANLCRLISAAHLGNPRGRPRTTSSALAERAEGLFVLSGCARGRLARLVASGRRRAALAEARRWRAAFGDGFRIEVSDHLTEGSRLQRARMIELARAAGVPAVATNDVHHGDPAGVVTHEVLNAIGRIVPLSATRALRPNAERYLKSAAEMRALFAGHPEVCDETLAIAEACDFELDLGTYHFPEGPGGDTHALLAQRCWQGLERRFGGRPQAAAERLQRELAVIAELGFSPFFTVVADIVDHVRNVLGVRCACRGSAAGSLVCYVLGISDVDPVRYGLLFERFMNGWREELPDIDIDVESHRREEVLRYIHDAYGPERTALCCMADTFRARLAIREVGKALCLPPEEVDLVAKAFPRIQAAAIPAALAGLPELARSNLSAGQLERLFELCVALDGVPRHLALHPSGVVLSSADLADRVPAQESFGGFVMLQADKDDVEDLGLVKLDVLGVRMLSAISHALSEVERTTGECLDLDALPRDDPATFELIRSSRTIGCFQIESPGQRELLARMGPASFEDLIVDISLFRPGPVKSDMVSPYLERRHGFEDAAYPHEDLRDILRETKGIIVFHEQLIRVIARVTGCSLGEADHVRRHLDDGGAEERYGGWFVERALANGYGRAPAGELWRAVFAFASFGFCKAHAAAFALPTYLSAYLKAHHPAPFFAGLLTHDPGMYPRRLIVADARRAGVPVLPVDVNRSHDTYRVEDGGVRLALTEVRGMSAAEIAALTGARAERPFTGLDDLWRRVALSQPVLENLIHVGALDTIEPGVARRDLLWRAAQLARKPRPAPGGQLSFDLSGPPSPGPGLPPYAPAEETRAELEVTGMDAGRHLMEHYAGLTAELGCVPAGGLSAVRNGAEVWVAGVKVASQTPALRSGRRVIFVTLDDPTGLIDVTLFERHQARAAHVVFHSWLLLVRGEVRKRGGASLTHEMDAANVGVTVIAREVLDLAEVAAQRAAGASLASALGRARRRGGGAVPPPGKLWHASGGSAGR